MKRILINLRFINIAFMFIMTNMFICNAQEVKPDKIFKNDGTKIESKVLEISPNEIKYKKYSNLNGPTYTILKSEIFLVEYANGDTEKMTGVSNPTASPITNYQPQLTQNPETKPKNELVGLQAYYGKFMGYGVSQIGVGYDLLT